jgi:hypothetical protein
LEYFKAIWNISRPFGILQGHLEYFKAIWNILRPFCKVSPLLVYYTEKIWQPCYGDLKEGFC